MRPSTRPIGLLLSTLAGIALLLPGARAQEPSAYGDGGSTVVARENDPLFNSLWHLKSRAQEVAGANVLNAWPLTKGAGVVIGIVDDGLQGGHPDLQPNYRSDLSFDFLDGDADPSPSSSTYYHGTAVAGVAAARDDNGVGVAGVAPRASLAGIRLTSGTPSDLDEANALNYAPDGIHVANNSWGPADDGMTLETPQPLTRAAMQSAVTSGRNGKGRIFVWSAGNGGEVFDLGGDFVLTRFVPLDNCNYDGFANSRFVIAVGALTDGGQKAFYSELCSALMVSAPSNGGVRGITTTDLVGGAGESGSDYNAEFGGTSSAAPVVSGVVALMLARNPNLTWRDVKHILRRSSFRLNPGDPGWTAGSFPHNEKYGFGQVDAQAAANLAATWTNVPAEATPITPPARSLNLRAPDNNATGVTDTITIGAAESSFYVEHVEVDVSVAHDFRGDLHMTLTSPSGVVSAIAPLRPYDDGDDYVSTTFMSVRHWGESPTGNWTLRVADGRPGYAPGAWTSWSLRIYGYRQVGPPPATPGNLTAVRTGAARVTLNWSASATATSYTVKRGTTPGSKVTIASGLTSTTYQDTTAATGKTYYYVVTAVNAGGESAPSIERSVLMPHGGAASTFTSDLSSDLGVYDRATGLWTVNGVAGSLWGAPGDIPVPADYNGDGRAEFAVWRPRTGEWWIQGLGPVAWGGPGDVPVPGDYDGNGTADIAVWRPSEGIWYVRNQASPAWGIAGDVPVPADYDGNGTTDIAVFRPSSGYWFVRGGASVAWGGVGDIPVPADYNGDGRAELAVYRPTVGATAWWYVQGVGAWPVGSPGDVPAPQDVNGDGQAELVIYRPSTGVYLLYFWGANTWTSLASPAGRTPLLLPVSLRMVARGDVDRDRLRDAAIFRPSTATWWLRTSTGSYVSQQWGSPGDVPVAGDYDGDGRVDFAVFTPSNGQWWILLSASNYTTHMNRSWGGAGDVPVPGTDFDGDGINDLTVFRPGTSNGSWYSLLSSTGFTSSYSWSWGLSTDMPVAGDFDGDGKTDVTIFRPSNGQWWSILSGSGFVAYRNWTWGSAGDRPVVADYDGDRISDIAIYQPSDGMWWILQSAQNFSTSVGIPWGGGNTYRLVPADYDGDGRADVGVYEPVSGMWFIYQSSRGSALSFPWGTAGDVVVP